MKRAMLWAAVGVWASLAVGAAAGAEGSPAALFIGGAHSRYVVRPLHGLGVELDTCKAGEAAKRLAGGKFNVVVAGTLDDADRKAVTAFLAKGGGALVCNPHAWSRTKPWTATNRWLAGYGARPRWEVLEDSDAANVVRDVMGCRLSWSDRVSQPVRDGVRGVLTLLWSSTGGCEPPMSFDLSKDWQVVVRGATSLRGRPDRRHDVHLQPWMPKEPGPPGPPLMALRQCGKGRLAVAAIRYYWIFTPPSHCPTAEAMLSAGAGGKPSDWIKVFAHAVRWLAEPSRQAGIGGAETPKDLLRPPVKVWPPHPPIDWTKHKEIEHVPAQPQHAGLIGARTALSSGKGSVGDYVKAAKAAGLHFIVFLEDSLKMDQAAWDKLVAACEAACDKTFAAVPGLTYEDAQGNHLYAFADQVKFPKKSMLLADRRLATVKSMRSRVIFDYVNEYMRQKVISGYWRHAENRLHPADYKLYNSFPIYTAEDGKQIDAAPDTYAYFMSLGAGQAALAFEIMNSPDQVAARAKDGRRVVWLRGLDDLRGKWHHGAWSFHGMMSQYVTSGPRILVWQGPNRLMLPRGQWWRPDLWQFRIRIRAGSEAGLKSVTIYDGPRVFRRWLPGGARMFQKELVLSNCRQLGLFPVVEDASGRKAVGMESWNRNCIMEEFFCSDRCNFLGNCRLRTRDGRQVWTQVSFQGNMGITPSKGRLSLQAQPAVCLTTDSPTLPIDGRPMGFPTAALRFNPSVPGELKYLFAYPVTYMVGPEIAVGQADYRLGYDPAEQGAKATRLGHAYEQPQHGWGNSWGSWHHLVPTRKLSGWSRIYACNWLTEGFRVGWFETNVTMKAPADVGEGGLTVMTASTPGWAVFRGGERVAVGENKTAAGAFGRGTFAALEHAGGSVIVVGMDDALAYRLDRGGRLSLRYAAKAGRLAKGDALRYRIAFAGAGSGTTMAQILDFARKFGIAQPGKAGYRATVRRGKELDTYLLWGVHAEGTAVVAKLGKAQMPGFLTACVTGLNDNWSAFLVERNRTGANFRALPLRDGRAFAQVDLVAGDLDVFLGHPVTCDRAEVKVQVAWQQPGVWYVEAHNPTDRAVKATLRTTDGWDKFAFRETITLKAGTSRDWRVRER